MGAGSRDGRGGSAVYPSIAAAGVDGSFTPLFALGAKAKRFDDRLYASIDRLAHEGVGEHMGLFDALGAVRAQLAEGSRARALLEAASHLGAGTRPADGVASLPVRKWLAPFLTDPSKSKPIGFYDESEALRRIFRHDRMLQTELEATEAAVIREALGREPAACSSYRQYLELTAALSGSLALGSVEDVDARRWAVLPPSDSAEGRLVKQLFGNAPVPAGFELGSEIVERVRDGRLPTEPRGGDGWYAHQFHALAALLSPESDRLSVGPLYRKELEETFKALFAMNRETHIKQLEAVAAGVGPPLLITPRVSVEPLPAFYARLAAGYRHVRGRLAALFGEHVLRSAELGGAGVDVWNGLVDLETLLLGAEAVSRDELGEPAERSAARDTAVARFRAWQCTSKVDEDLAADIRIAVPLWTDLARKTVRIAATVGVETRLLSITFAERPAVRVWPDGQHSVGELSFQEAKRTIVSPITIECDVRVPPTRDEFRAICDRCGEPGAIRKALEAGLTTHVLERRRPVFFAADAAERTLAPGQSVDGCCVMWLSGACSRRVISASASASGRCVALGV